MCCAVIACVKCSWNWVKFERDSKPVLCGSLEFFFKELLVLVISKTFLMNWQIPQKNWPKNHRFFDFFTYLRTMVIYRSQFFEYFETWWVSVRIPGLITGRYLSFILRTGQHWLKPSTPPPLAPTRLYD